MRVALMAQLALVALTIGCSDGSTSVGTPGPQTGGLTGSVTLLGTDDLDPSGVRLSLFATLEGYEERKATYEAPLVRQGSHRTFAFELTGVAPGDYFMIACFNFGCGDYRNRESGALIPVRVEKGRITSITFSL